jgi:hypothetical protein
MWYLCILQNRNTFGEFLHLWQCVEEITLRVDAFIFIACPRPVLSKQESTAKRYSLTVT